MTPNLSDDTPSLSPFDTAVLRVIANETQQGWLPTKEDIVRWVSEQAAQAMNGALAKLEQGWYIRVRQEEPNDSGSRVQVVHLLSGTGQKLLDVLDTQFSAE